MQLVFFFFFDRWKIQLVLIIIVHILIGMYGFPIHFQNFQNIIDSKVVYFYLSLTPRLYLFFPSLLPQLPILTFILPIIFQGSTLKINFCQWCGGPTKHDIPEGEEKIRAICTLCGKITYQNPKMVGLIKAQVILRLTIFFLIGNQA